MEGMIALDAVLPAHSKMQHLLSFRSATQWYARGAVEQHQTETTASVDGGMRNHVAWGMFWGILSAISLPVGALVGISINIPDRIRSAMMAFGAGALL